MEEILLRTIEGLKRRGFEAVGVATKAEALKLVMDEAEKAESVGWGGSESVKEVLVGTVNVLCSVVICKLLVRVNLECLPLGTALPPCTSSAAVVAESVAPAVTESEVTTHHILE